MIPVVPRVSINANFKTPRPQTSSPRSRPDPIQIEGLEHQSSKPRSRPAPIPPSTDLDSSSPSSPLRYSRSQGQQHHFNGWDKKQPQPPQRANAQRRTNLRSYTMKLPRDFDGGHQYQQTIRVGHQYQQKSKKQKSSKRKKRGSNNSPRKDTSLFDLFDLARLPQYKHVGLRKITIEPPSYQDRKDCYTRYNKEDRTWHTILFPPKLPLGGKDARLIEQWLNITCAEYFHLRLHRSSSETLSDVRLFHLAALNELANQVSDTKSSHGKILQSICHRIGQLDCSNLKPHELSNIAIGREKNNKCKRQLQKEEDQEHRQEQSQENTSRPPLSSTLLRDRGTQKIRELSNAKDIDKTERQDQRNILLKQAQIIAELQEAVRFNVKLRIAAEERLKQVMSNATLNV